MSARAGPDEVRAMAALAALALSDEEVARLWADLEQILAFMEALSGVEVGDAPSEGSSQAPYRPPDMPPDPLRVPLERFAPDLREGFFVVPRLPAVAGRDREEGEGPGQDAPEWPAHPRPPAPQDPRRTPGGGLGETSP